MAKVTFDGDNLLIIADPGITALNVEQDLYSDWKEWALLADNIKYLDAFRTIGGDPLTGTLNAGAFFFLQNQNGWRIRPDEADHELKITGNLYPEDTGTDMFVPTVGAFTVSIFLETSSLTQEAETRAALTAAQDSKLTNIDTLSTSNLDATISSRFATASAPANFSDLSIEASTGRMDLAKIVGDAPAATALQTNISNLDAAVSGRASQVSVDNVQTAVDTVDDYVDTEIANIQSRLPASLTNGKMESNVGAIDGDTDAAVRMALSAKQIVPGTVDDSFFTPTHTEFESGDITTNSAEHYNGRVIIFTSGFLAGQAVVIQNYEMAGSNSRFLVSSLTDPPVNTDSFIII